MKYGYNFDGVTTVHNADFMNDIRFKRAYERGKQSLSSFKINIDYQWYWRVYIGLWAASQAFPINGDFVECGVASGFMSSAICQYLEWNKWEKNFYLLDTFEGVDKTQLSKQEIRIGRGEENIFNHVNYDSVVKNFSEWKNIFIIKGIIPYTLDQIMSDKISFIHVDLNCAEPERHVFIKLFPKLQKGGYILLDDYGYLGYRVQKLMWDKLSEEYNFPILSLPTGQGIIIKN